MAKCDDTNYQLGCHTNTAGEKIQVLIRTIDDSDGATVEILDLNLARVAGADPTNTVSGACTLDSEILSSSQAILNNLELKPDQTHVRVSGVTNNIPAGLKSFVLVLTSGTATINGNFPLDLGVPYPESASQLKDARALLPALEIDGAVGSTWKWIGFQPVEEK